MADTASPSGELQTARKAVNYEEPDCDLSLVLFDASQTNTFLLFPIDLGTGHEATQETPG